MPIIALVLLVPFAVIALMPLILLQRYRLGRARRQARPWLATLNVIGMLASTFFFLVTASITSWWVPAAFRSALLGLAAGGALGMIGVALSRWEPTAAALHYTPNRWLVLFITLLVSARLIYSLVQGIGSLDGLGANASWATSFGVAGSLAAAATVVGYYLSYAIALRWRIARWQKRRLRVL